eukprot:2722499-Amphidinium_carterae.1
MRWTWRRALRVLSCFGLCGAVVQVARDNKIAGTLPDAGMRALAAVNYFDISRNSVTGTLGGGV